MSAYRVLVEFLRHQAKNRSEQADIRLRDIHPNTQLIGKFRTESRMFEQAADLIETMPAPLAKTAEESTREQLAAEAAAPAAPTVVVEKPAPKRIGRPPKMTAKQIAEASVGPASARESRASDDAAAAEALRRA